MVDLDCRQSQKGESTPPFVAALRSELAGARGRLGLTFAFAPKPVTPAAGEGGAVGEREGNSWGGNPLWTRMRI